MEMGQAEQRMIRECYRRKKPLPERIQNAPDLLVGLELTFDAFTELNTCRQTGWSAGPIPSWCIDDYAERLDLDAEETEDLLYLIRMMDQAFLKHIAAKNKESS
jgi:hypothetical protein